MAFIADTEKIKRWRQERQWSQEHLAHLAGIGLRTLQRVENGEPASSETLRALAAAYDVDVMALMVDEDAQALRTIRTEHSRASIARSRSLYGKCTHACFIEFFVWDASLHRTPHAREHTMCSP